MKFHFSLDFRPGGLSDRFPAMINDSNSSARTTHTPHGARALHLDGLSGGGFG
jgi:hypothetical protein